MAQRFVKLSPLQESAVIARLKPLNGVNKIYFTFVPNSIYEVDEAGLNGLKKEYKLVLTGRGGLIQQGIDMGLKFTKSLPCVSCAKKRNRNPEDYAKYEFEMFVEVDSEGNILTSEYV